MAKYDTYIYTDICFSNSESGHFHPSFAVNIFRLSFNLLISFIVFFWRVICKNFLYDKNINHFYGQNTNLWKNTTVDIIRSVLKYDHSCFVFF